MDLYYTNPYRTYDSATDKTKIFLPWQHISTKKLAVLALGGSIGATDVGGVNPQAHALEASGYIGNKSYLIYWFNSILMNEINKYNFDLNRN